MTIDAITWCRQHPNYVCDALLTRFRDKIHEEPNSGCWLWDASACPLGYGTFWDSRVKKVVKAHRFAYALWVGPIGDQYVLHRCDNPSCVNPAHLFLGSHKDNMADMAAKGRSPRGEGHAHCKLTNRQVSEIRGSTLPMKELAAKYGVSRCHIGRLRRGAQRVD